MFYRSSFYFNSSVRIGRDSRENLLLHGGKYRGDDAPCRNDVGPAVLFLLPFLAEWTHAQVLPIKGQQLSHGSRIFDCPVGALEWPAKMALVDVFEAAAGTFRIGMSWHTSTKHTAIAVESHLTEVRALLLCLHNFRKICRPHVTFKDRYFKVVASQFPMQDLVIGRPVVEAYQHDWSPWLNVLVQPRFERLDEDLSKGRRVSDIFIAKTVDATRVRKLTH